MKIKTIVVGTLKENCYILTQNDETIIIDPGDEPDNIINNITGKVLGIIITHYHFDHIGALEELKTKYKVPIIDYKNIGSNQLGSFNFEILETKGHTKDSVTIYFKDEKTMFCGDFIFKNSIGRTDLPTGSNEEMKRSLKNIVNYDHNITLYPGHYNKTLLANEIDNINYYIERL